MKKNILYLLLVSLSLPSSLLAELTQSVALAEKITGKSQQKRRKADISFVFKDEYLIDIINMLAAKKNINIVLPTGANAINTKVNLAIDHKLTLKEAWDILYTLLDIAGYSLIPKKDLYLVVKNSKNISRESLPIYINTPISDIPSTDERIRYMYYLSNIKASQEFDNQLGALFKELLPEDALYKADKGANGILLIAKAQDIKSLMSIVEAMDQTGFQERLEVVRLRYTTADTVAKIFNESILKTAASTPVSRFRPGSQRDQAVTYFSKNVKVIAEPRTNSLVVLGRVQAVERVKDFIFKYIDIQLDSGKSILHMYELQYLDADEFAPVLQNIVDSSRSGGTEQSKAGGAQVGTERFFDQVIIQPDSPAQASEEGEEGKYFGGNKLVVAARNDDWKRIKVLIEQLDKPQPQVIIEVLIADLTLDDARRLGSISRNPKDLPFPGEVTAQSAMIDQVVLDSDDAEVINTLRGVNSDLNSITVPSANPSIVPSPVSIPQNLVAGTAVIALNDNDGRTWSLLEILKIFDHTKILSHPHIIATNNQKAVIEVGESRLVEDQAAPSTSGITRRKKTLQANTNLHITPRISTANTVNLQVVIDIDQFQNATVTNGNRINRDLTTNASIKSGDILALGGLVRDQTEDRVVQTPILSKIPILGWLFKRKDKTINQTSLTIFITPTIIQPKLRGGVGQYTKTYVEVAKDYSRQGALFDNLRDPVTRWFFKVHNEATDVTDEFLTKDEITQVSHAAEGIDSIAQEEGRLLDEHLNIIDESLNRQGELKGMLSNQDNPLQRRETSAPQKQEKTTPPIAGTTIAQQKPQNNLKKSHAQQKQSCNTNCSTKKITPQPSKKRHLSSKNCNTCVIAESKEISNNHNKNLKDLLVSEENPLKA
ncbi:MAG: secretin N-terminal domain-containing protein [Candidatus Dependentiae bacterium]